MQREPDLVAGRWRKLVWNVPFNGLSVVLGALPGELLADPDGAALVRALMVEVQQGAAACDREIPDDFLQLMLELTVGIPHHRTSMYLDHQAGRPLEVEAMFANPVAAAAARGVELPRLATLRDQVRFLDPARRAS
jgi:2-dehydropantoate 2-reductase